MSIKFQITKIDQETFFLRLGAVVIVDYDEGRVYDENREQYMPLDVALKTSMDGERVVDE